MESSKGEIVIYQTNNGTEVKVQFEKETVWLSQRLMAELFEKDSDTIGFHIKSIFKEEELSEEETTEYFSVVQKEGKKQVNRKIKFYNLDVILSVGYRVNSKRGTQFRKWATQRLKDHLVKGYTINKQRLQQLSINMQDLQKAVQLIQQSSNSSNIKLKEAKGLLYVLSQYTQSFILLNQYDSQTLKLEQLSENITYEIKYTEAKAAILELKRRLINKKEASNLFGNEKDESFSGILNSVIQTFDGKYLYPSIEEQAAHLLYFLIKSHPFSDGNKRIGAFLFVWFLEKNKHRFKKNGELKINANTLTALALLVAQSNPIEKEVMIKLIINLIKN